MKTKDPMTRPHNQKFIDYSDEFDDLLDTLISEIWDENPDDKAICELADEISRRYHSLEKGYENLIG